MTIDHTSVSVPKDKYESVVAFYEKALGALDYKKAAEYPFVTGMSDADGEVDFWISGKDVAGEGQTHIAFRTKDHETVDRFYETAVAMGAKDNGKPGLRVDYGPKYYAAFVIAPCGNNIEVVCQT